MKAFGKYLSFISFILVGLLAFTFTSCGGSSDGDGNTGRVSLSLSDAPNTDYQAVYVTVAEIQIHKADAEEDSWQTILAPNTTYNLLDLVNGTTADLGVADLSTGTYTQMRLILADDADSSLNILGETHPYPNYVITTGEDAEAVQLRVPSGYQSGIKLVHSFEVESGRTVGLVLDFDASRSVVEAGNSGNLLLKPTIKVIGTVNNATLTGIVTDEEGTPIEGAVVSVQQYDADTDEVTIVQGTITSSGEGNEGEYLMYLEPGTYTIVVTTDNFSTAYEQVIADYDDELTQNFTLVDASMGIVTVGLTLTEDDSEEPAVIEFRQTTPGYGMIAVKDMNYSVSGSYDVSLPVGTYSIDASYGDLEETADDFVLPGAGITIPIDFTQP